MTSHGRLTRETHSQLPRLSRRMSSLLKQSGTPRPMPSMSTHKREYALLLTLCCLLLILSRVFLFPRGRNNCPSFATMTQTTSGPTTNVTCARELHPHCPNWSRGALPSTELVFPYSPLSLPAPRPFLQFLVECLGLNLQFGQIEPFFCSLALYDLGKRSKISENFYFDKNPQSLLSKLGRHLVGASPQL